MLIPRTRILYSQRRRRARYRSIVDSQESGPPHPSFSPPPPEAKLWRYVDLPKYLAMLDSKALWFARVDQLDDPFEGSVSQANIRERPSRYKHVIPSGPWQGMADYRRELRSHTYVTCWHESEEESAAMWQRYVVGHGIVVQSTYDRMRSALTYGSVIHVGRVTYASYERDWIPEGNLYDAMMSKRLSFSHEREVRAVVADWSRKPSSDELGAGLDPENPPLGVAVPANLATLIAEVRVAPDAPQWLAELISNVTRMYGLPFAVKQSDLSADPVY